GTDLYLRIAPELYLKRLVVGGLERVYEINRNFRNEGVSSQHNPEFTMLEFYTAWFDCGDVMGMTEELIEAAAAGVVPGKETTYKGRTLRLTRPFKRISMKDAISAVLEKQSDLNWRRAILDDPDELEAWLRSDRFERFAANAEVDAGAFAAMSHGQKVAL